MAWKHYICEIDEQPASVLIDERFAGEFPLKDLPDLFWVAVYFNLPAEGSFRHPDETLALEDIEKNLLNLAQSFGNGWIVYVMRIDTAGVREYFFYYGKDAEVDKAAALLKSLHPSYRIESETQEDRDWAEYKKYISFESDDASTYIN